MKLEWLEWLRWFRIQGGHSIILDDERVHKHYLMYHGLPPLKPYQIIHRSRKTQALFHRENCRAWSGLTLFKAVKVVVEACANPFLHCEGIGHEDRAVGD